VELGESYRVLPFSAADEVDENDVIELWDREGVVPRAVGAERVSELACVGLDRDDGLVGVSTAYLAASPQLRTEMWHYRTFVTADHRHGNLARYLLRETRLYLEQRFASGEDTRAPGILFEIENEEIKKLFREAVWEHEMSAGVQYIFIGENAKRDHLRVHYFPGALAPLPG
jgi:hypothetical protein